MTIFELRTDVPVRRGVNRKAHGTRGPLLRFETCEARILLTQGAGPLLYTEGHADIGLALVDDAFTLRIESDGATIGGQDRSDEVFDAEDVQILVPDSTQITTQGTSDFFDIPESLGLVQGTPYWNLFEGLFESNAAEAPYLGLAAESVDLGVLQGDMLRFSLTGVDGPGSFTLWSDGSGVVWDSFDGLTDDSFAAFPVGPGAHTHYNFAFSAPGVYQLELTAEANLVGGGSVSGSGVATFLVSDVLVEPGLGGFSLQLQKPIFSNPSQITLYGSGEADVEVRNAQGQVIPGSLVIDADAGGFAFVAVTPNGLLTPGEYQVELRGDLVNSPETVAFNVPDVPEVVLSLPDVLRGPGQPIDLPLDQAGWPVTISQPEGLTRIGFDLVFDPELLQINDATLTNGLPNDAEIAFQVIEPGRVRLVLTAETGLGADDLQILRLVSSIPDDAPLLEKQVVTFENLDVEGPGGVQIDDLGHRDPLVALAYPGDVLLTDNSYSFDDAATIVRIALAFPNEVLDYANLAGELVADANGNGFVDLTDAVLVLSAALGIPNDLPERTATSPPVPGGRDPRIAFSEAMGPAGGTVTTALTLEITDPQPVPLRTFRAVATFDPDQFTVASVDLGDWGRQYETLWHVDNTSGLLVIGGYRAEPLVFQPGAFGTLAHVELDLAEKPTRSKAVLNLVSDATVPDVGSLFTMLNGGDLVLQPAPDNVAGDELDGIIRIASGTGSLEPVVVDPARASNYGGFDDSRGRRGLVDAEALEVEWADLTDEALGQVGVGGSWRSLVFWLEMTPFFEPLDEESGLDVVSKR